MPETDATTSNQQVEQPGTNSTPEIKQNPAQDKVDTSASQGLGNGAENTHVLTEQEILKLADNPSFQKLISDQASKIAESKVAEGLRNIQSLTDKSEARVRKEVVKQVALLQAAMGTDLSPEQKAKVEQVTRQQVVEEMAGEINGDAPQQQPEQQNPLAADVQRLVTKYGNVAVFQGDPEAALVKTNGTPGEYLETFEKAIKAKIDRVSGKKTPEPKDEEKNPQGSMTASANKGTGTLPDLGYDDLFAMAYKKK